MNERRDLDYGDVTADADRMQAVLEMRALGHTDACIDSGHPGDERTPGCAGCAIVAQFPYVDADFDDRPSHDLRVGDWIAGRGPVGSGRWLAREVTYVGTGALFGVAGYATYLTTTDAPSMRPVIILDKTVKVLRMCPHARTPASCEWCTSFPL
jgi:hypothetical protein